MITQTFESKRPPPKTFLPILPKQSQQSYPGTKQEERPTQSDKTRADQFGITPEEFVRRDKIVRQSWIDCQFRQGEILRPKTEADFKMYGRCTVRGAFKSYHDFPVEEAKQWPETDNPFILTCSPEKGTEKLLVVTHNWLSRFNHGDC